LVIVLDWFAETPLFTDWLPLPTWTPGLMFAPAFTALLAMLAFASTPTFGFTFRFGFALRPLVLGCVADVVLLPVVVLDWPTEEPCVLFDVAPVLDDCWFAVTPLVTLWLPLPTCTPGLMLAPRFTSVLLMFAFASTPTFGLTFSDGLMEVELLEAEGCVETAGCCGVEGDVAEGVPLAPGLVAETEPLIEGRAFEAAAAPLVEPVEVDAEPLTVPLALLGLVLPMELVVPKSLVPATEPAEPVAPEMEPLVPLRLLPVVPAVVPAGLLSSRQSSCTGLAERSFALPVSLSASLPALGFLKLLHGCSVDEAARSSRSPRPELIEPLPEFDCCCVAVEPDCLPEWSLSASAGVAESAPMTAAARRLRVNG